MSEPVIQVEKPGLLTTIQDAGRAGYQQYGIVVSGAMDPFAVRAANLLAGNKETEAAFGSHHDGTEAEISEGYSHRHWRSRSICISRWT